MKNRKKRVFLLIFLIIIILIGIKVFQNSMANKTIDITAEIVDNSGLLPEQEYNIQAKSDEEGKFYFSLPAIVNNYKIEKYILEKKAINNVNETKDNETSNEIENDTEKNDILEKKPEEILYLTEEELNNKTIKLSVEYLKKEKENQTLYNKVLEKNIEENLIEVEGFFPLDTTLEVEKADNEETKTKLKEFINEKTELKIAYNIKLISEEKEYTPKEIGENLKVTINGKDIVKEENKKYRVIKIDNQEKVSEIENVENEAEKISFDLNESSIYALLVENTEKNQEQTQDDVKKEELTEKGVLYSTKSADIHTNAPWDGITIATEFCWGEGTKEQPFLITDGTELAYLGQEVRNGNTFEGQYFQLATDIDLGNKEWTPIGNNQNSFRGIFDGAGHTIGNAKIYVSEIPDNTYETYGIFASIGGGSSRTIIRNLELSNINIDITASGDTGSTSWGSVNQPEEGLHIGCLSGAMYKNASILNVIVKNSLISDSGTINITHYPFQLSIGGMVGYITNGYDNNADLGSNEAYVIDNCYSEATIDIDATADLVTSGGIFSAKRDGRPQYHTGGIVGTIRAQVVWPTNCLYSGDINSNGFIGPIFGALINNTSYTNANNYNTIWSGNDGGMALTPNNMYYTNYRSNGKTFTGTVTGNPGNSDRNSTNSSNIGYVQGVNKGSYTNNMDTLLNIFNNNVTEENQYVNWYYQGGTFSFKERLTATVEENAEYTYEIKIDDPYQIGEYTLLWYKNGELDSTIQGPSYKWDPNYENDEEMMVVINDNKYYTVVKFTIKKIGVDIVFDIDKATDSVTASLEGEGMEYTSIDEFTFQWYEQDISGEGGPIEGETSLKLSGLKDGMDYKLVATNTKKPQLSAENTFTYGDRTVIYVKYSGGNDRNNGLTPETPVQTLSTAYSKLRSDGTRNNNVIVLMGYYNDSRISFLDSETSTTYAKNATITGKYKGVDYDGSLRFGSYSDYYRFLTADLTFQYLELNGGSNSNSMYLLCQGHDLTIGEGVTMTNYKTADSTQGLLGNRAPAFHVFAGWYQYNESKLPNNDCEILIKSGTYGRVILGGTPGTSSGLNQPISHNFMGSSMEDSFRVSVTIDIKNSTTPSNYDYDVNLLVGGSASGNNYSRVTENIKAGKVGRVLGGSIGDSSDRPSRWDYPINTFLGETTINQTGGTIAELYGGCLGRNMSAIGGGWRPSTIECDSYFYGTTTFNMTAGEVTGNIYGAGAGGVSGYDANSSDEYKSYGQEFHTSVNINISGGTVKGNIYGGGYGYTEYLTEEVTADDGGSLYGDSNITITGSPTIEGDIYAAGCGYNLSSKPNLAQMKGNSNIDISGTPTIHGKVFGAGAGISGFGEMAKLIGNSNVNISSDLNVEVYGGGNIAKTEGKTSINIQDGNHTGDIYGGGNVGIVAGDTVVNINGGTTSRVYGGGNQAETNTSTINVNGGTTDETYAGGNSASVDETKTYIKGGTANTVYGGSNQAGDIQNSYIETTSGQVGTIYGGNNIGGTTVTTNIEINGGTIENVYGGGEKAQSTTSNIKTSLGEVENIFGGGNQAGVTTTNINTIGGNIKNIFGGSNKSGIVDQSNVTTNDGKNAKDIIENVYGGNNQGGTTQNTKVTINGGGVVDVYGGGNQAETNSANVLIKGKVSGSVYGGGNQAGVNTDTNLNLEEATVEKNVYGGGNEGTVSNNTYVHVKNSTLGKSLYAGGNGTSAVVYGNTNLVLEGTTNYITESVFGGGNKAATGTEENNNSVSTVNIVGGTILKNVYGGANTSVVYGTTQTNIGYETVKNSSLEKGDIKIDGTVFGGGEANEAGDEDYDFSFISVTEGIDIQIDGEGHEDFAILGSIFGSGNASSTSGESYITIKNYGTADEPQSNISLQRANCATIINSAISLSGATDRTNEYSNTFFSISRVDKVKLKNNSVLYLCNGANLLKELESLVDENGQEVTGIVTIDEETGDTTRNVDNRIYMLEGKNLNIATNEQVTAYGTVKGMIFLGLFTNKNNPSTSTGFYHNSYKNGDTIKNPGTFVSNSYAMAQHMVEHDLTKDGFYTNFNEEGKIRTKYIETTPKDDVYYIWLVGEKMDVTRFELGLTASKYATLGTYELLLQGFSDPNIKFSLAGFSAGLANGVSLVDPSEIQAIDPDQDRANNTFGLTMKTGNTGWQSEGTTTFLTKDGGTYTGQSNYNSDNSTFTPTLNFCLYHSQNIDLKRALGDVSIRLQVLTPIDDLNYKLSYIDIVITLSTELYQDNFYEAAITPGEEYGLFTTTETNITSKSTFSTYYSLYIEQFSESEYAEEYKTDKRYLVSLDENGMPYSFPKNTKITMLDRRTNSYYYYIVTEQDEAQNKTSYALSDFIVMGTNELKFDEETATETYYDKNQDIAYENFIFHITFADANINEDIENYSVLMELRDKDGETLLGVLGIQRGTMLYSVYPNKDATIKVDATIDPETIYLGDTVNLDVTTEFAQTIINSKTIYDTQYFDKKLGIKISVYDINGNRLNSDSLLGVYFEIDDQKYYPRIDGTTRICISDKVTNVLAKIKINTQNNKTLATGDYKIKIESFGSPDGIYYGLEASDQVEKVFKVINLAYGLKVKTSDNMKIIDKESGNNLNDNNSLPVEVEYSSSLENPMITVSLYRRNYEEDVYSQKYDLVDLKDYVTNMLTPSNKEKEYIAFENPQDTITDFYLLKQNLMTGTYKLVYKLYDGENYIGEAYEYFVVM